MLRLIFIFISLAIHLHVVGTNAAEVELDGQVFQLPDGFTIERVAGSPLVDRPISADFDDVGRLYVTDSSGSNAPLKQQLVEKPHRIVRLEDTNNDGHFDKSIVFADQMMFPEGAMWYDGSLYVAAPPSIWKLTDTDGDGVADQREEWYQGKTLTGCGNDLHGPYLGPDGFIYWCKGAWAEQTFKRPGRPPLVTKAAHIFRCRADTPLDPQTGSIDTSFIEPVMTGGMDNPVEVAFTPGGERIFTTTFLVNPGGGQRDGLIHAIYGGVYGKPKRDALAGHPRTGELMPVLKHLGAAAPSGLARYESSAFGNDYKDNLFACLFNMRKITRNVLVPEGASFSDRDEDFLVSDNYDFHPTDVLEDADGSLIVVNTGGWYKLCCPSSQLEKADILGAIYRVRRIDTSRPDDPRGNELNWPDLTPASLARLLDDSRPAVRHRAVQALAKRGTRAVEVLARLLNASASAHAMARLNAVWTLTQINDPQARIAVRIALVDADDDVRQAAIHSVSVWRDSGAFTELVAVLDSASEQNRRAAAEALGRIGDRRAVPYLLAAASVPHDRACEHSLTFALIQLADSAQTRAGLSANSRSTQRVALIALDQMDEGQLAPSDVVPLLQIQSPEAIELRRTAGWIVDRHPDWGARLIDYFRDELDHFPADKPNSAGIDSDSSFDVKRRQEFQHRLARFASSAPVLDMLLEGLRGPHFSTVAKTAILRAMAQSSAKAWPPRWADELANILRHGPSKLVPEVVSALKTVPAAENGGEKLVAGLLDIGHDPNQSTELRLAAMSVVPGGLSQVDTELFDLLGRSLDSEQPVNQRAAAVEVLTHANLSSMQLIALTTRLATVSPLDIAGLLKAFERTQDEAVGMALVQSLAESPARSALRTETLKPQLDKFPPTVVQQAEQLYSVLRADRAEQSARLEQLLKSMPEGDIRRGQAIFRSARAACLSCHEIGYQGGHVGPDLSHIARIRSRRDLLEAIVFPSASLVRSFEPSIIMTTTGLVHNGLLQSSLAQSGTGDEIVLVTGPDKQVRIPRGEIEEILPGTVSVMPAGLDKQLTEQQLADLLAFLQSTK